MMTGLAGCRCRSLMIAWCSFVAHLDLEDVRVEGLVREAVAQFVVVERQFHRRFTGTVQDTRHLARTTQAAARTFPLIATELQRSD